MAVKPLIHRSLTWWIIGAAAAAGLGLAVGLAETWAVLGFGAILVIALYVAILLRFPERGLWLLTIGLPYERLGALPLGFFTLKFGHVVSLFMVASWIGRSVLTRTIRFAYDPLRLPLLLLLGASLLSLANAVDISRGLALVGQLVIGYLVYTLVINFLTRGNLKPTLVALWVGAGLVGLFGMYQFVGDFAGLPSELTGLLPSYSGQFVFGFARIQGPSLEPLYFANYLLLPILTAAAFLVATRGRGRLWLVSLILVLLVVFVLTLARGAYVGLAIGLVGLLIAFWREVFRPRVIVAVGSAGLLTLLITMGLLIRSGTPGEEPLAAFQKQIIGTGHDVSSKQRINSVAAAANLVEYHPWIGIGVGQFGEYYQDPPTSYGNPPGSQVVNNQPLETLVETGIFGLLALAAVGAVLAGRTYRAWGRVRGRFLRAALVGSALAVLAISVQALSFSALYLMHVWFAIGLLVGVQNLILVPRKAAQSQSGPVLTKDKLKDRP